MSHSCELRTAAPCRSALGAPYRSARSSCEVRASRPAGRECLLYSPCTPSCSRRARRTARRDDGLASPAFGDSGGGATASRSRSVETRATGRDLELIAAVLCPRVLVVTIGSGTPFSKAHSLDAVRGHAAFREISLGSRGAAL